MFCPKCAAQNIDGVSFCRVCGANISLVPQALTGRLPEAETPPVYIGYRSRRSRRGRNSEPPTLERGIVNVFMGLGFIVAALAIMWKFPGGIFWGWSFFFPGFSCLGRGVAILAAQKQQAPLAARLDGSNALGPQPLNNAVPEILPRRNTGEMVPPPASVTEGTTRHLGAEASTRHLDS